MFGSLGEALAKIGEGIANLAGNIVNGVKDFFMWIVDAVVKVASGIWDFFKDPIGSIVSLFNWVKDFLGGLLDGFLDLFKSIFMPKDGFFDRKFTSMQKTMDSKINISEYSSALDNVQNAQGIRIGGARSSGASWLGVPINIDFMRYVDEYKPTINMIFRGVMFITLLLYNINNVYKLVRGGDIDEGGDD